MKPKSMLLFLVAAGFGLVAMLGVMQALEAKPDKEPTVDVLVAIDKIPPGVPLDESNTVFKTLPISAAPKGAITERLQTEKKALISQAVADDVITEQKLSENAFSPSNAIPPGMRAETIRVDASMSHSGLLRPGDRVDVICTYRVTENSRQVTKTKLILEYVEVFAADARRSSADSDGDAVAKHVTLLVNPEQSVLLNLTKQRGTLSLTLRSKLDDEVVNVASISDAILGDGKTSHAERERAPTPTPVLPEPAVVAVAAAPEPAAPPEPEIPTWQMTIFSGNDVQDFEVVDEDAMKAMGLDADARRRARAATRRPNRPASTTTRDTSGDAKAASDGDVVDGPAPVDTAVDPETGPVDESGEGGLASDGGDGTWVDAGLDFLESL